MCGRYALYGPYLSDDPEWVDGWVERIRDPLAGIARYNIAPSQVLPVVVREAGRPVFRQMRWGLIPGWAKDPKIGYSTINARAESVLEKPSYRQAWRAGQRCLVPVTGWYEWRELAPRRKQAYYFHASDARNPMMFAGLWSRWESPSDGPLYSYTIITTEAVDIVREVHDRQPRVLTTQDWNRWLETEPQDAERWLQPESIPVAYHPVGSAVGNVRNDDPRLVQPLPEAQPELTKK
ncbi:MAG: SOS response-associated peptidase [Gammaproteobacteria bacterium]